MILFSFHPRFGLILAQSLLFLGSIFTNVYLTMLHRFGLFVFHVSPQRERESSSGILTGTSVRMWPQRQPTSLPATASQCSLGLLACATTLPLLVPAMLSKASCTEVTCIPLLRRVSMQTIGS